MNMVKHGRCGFHNFMAIGVKIKSESRLFLVFCALRMSKLYRKLTDLAVKLIT